MDFKSFFSPTTRRGRAIRTAFQGALGITTFTLGLLTLPGFAELMNSSGLPVQAATIGAWIGVVSYVQNALEALTNYIWGSK